MRFIPALALLATLAAIMPLQHAQAETAIGESMTTQRMRAGREALAQLNPKAEANLHAALDDIAPDMVEMVVPSAMGTFTPGPDWRPWTARW